MDLRCPSDPVGHIGNLRLCPLQALVHDIPRRLAIYFAAGFGLSAGKSTRN